MSRRTLLWILAAWLAAGAVAAEERVGTHIVRPGDTLRGLTRQHLGVAGRWEENWRLNPDVEDPDVLVPGQRIRILVPRLDAPIPTARVVALSGNVEERPSPVDWQSALQDDLLLEKDGVRTPTRSSMGLQFSDGTLLAVTEGSLVFLRRAGRSLEGVDENSIEIVEGQAEIAASDPSGPRARIEIVIGKTIATPSGDEVQARARKSATGGAAVMVYEGSGEVESGGETVAVERGMGTVAPADGPPTPPEKLLAAPIPTSPAAGDRLPYPDPEFSWQPVDGAAGYVLEVCADVECLRLVRRQTGLSESTWRAAPLPVADHYWRVTAVSTSGLDGYPSSTAAFTVLTDRRDDEPPVAEFELEGPSVTSGATTYHAPRSTVTVTVEDALTGVEAWSPVIDGRRGSESELAGPWSDGDHAVDAWVRDGADNEGTREGLRFSVDAEAPVLELEPGAEEAVSALLAGVEKPERWRRRWRLWQKRAERSTRRGDDPALWALVAWKTDALADEVGAEWSANTLRWRERRSHQTVTHAGGAPVLLLVAPRVALPAGGEALGDRMLLVRAVDEKAGSRTLSVRSALSPDGPVLEIETVDRLGNRRIERLPFLPPGG